MEFYGNVLGLNLVIRRDDLPENREVEFSPGGGALVVYESVEQRTEGYPAES